MSKQSFGSRSLLVALLVVPLPILVTPLIVHPQGNNTRHKAFAGPLDSECPYPIIEGTAGRKDPTAISQIDQFSAFVPLADGQGVEGKGTATFGSGKNARQLQASFDIEAHGHFRMDVEEGNAVRSLRMTGDRAQARRGDGPIEEVNDSDFANPLAIPLQLKEVANRQDASVIDDGIVTVNDRQLSRITITLFRTHIGNPVAASFYFDPQTHILTHAAFIGHSGTNQALVYLKVVTYASYKRVESALLPTEYVETMDGQPLMTLQLSSANLSASHSGSYFTFER
jgi:hypothetical protein